ncbi:MAG: RNA polymerase sigma factor [Planctomycetes bacterium]|nr:RNA polymerase sigma factor [Planctomycetota bacterium]
MTTPDVATPEGFRAAAEGCHAALLRVAARMVGDAHAAEDLVQETFVRAFAARGRFRGDARPFTWFCAILLNLAKNELRRRAVRRLFSLGLLVEAGGEPAAPGAGPAARAEGDDEGRALRAAIARLPHMQRAALVLVSLEGLPAADAARALRTTEAAVWQALSRGRAALRRDHRD